MKDWTNKHNKREDNRRYVVLLALLAFGACLSAGVRAQECRRAPPCPPGCRWDREQVAEPR